MAKQREFTIQVRFHSDDPEYFDSMKQVMQKQCREIKAMCVILAGPGVTPPAILLMSEDFAMGSEEIDFALTEQEALQEQIDRGGSDDMAPPFISREDKLL